MTRKNEIKIYPCGIFVKIKIQEIIGSITCCSIRFDNIMYEITYFVQGEHRQIWLNESEFITRAKKTVIVGFK